MIIEDLNQLVTKKDLEHFRVELCRNLLLKLKPLKEFYTPKEFEAKTGIPYSTVVYKCNTGKLKAIQDSPNCSWLIHSSELERLVKEANANVTGEYI